MDALLRRCSRCSPPPSRSGARRSPGSSSSPSCSRSRWSCFNIRVNPLGWPLAIVSSLLYFALFWNSRLYGDASLQIFFAVVALWGWWQWLRGTQADGSALRGARAVGARGAAVALGALRARLARDRPVPRRAAPTPTCPGGTPSRPPRACVGQWLLGRKYVENWPAWVVVNVVSVGAVRLQGAVADGAAVRAVHRDVGRRLARVAAAARGRSRAMSGAAS